MGSIATTIKKKSMFVLLVDLMMGKEALVLLIALSGIIATKMDETISHVKG